MRKSSTHFAEFLIHFFRMQKTKHRTTTRIVFFATVLTFVSVVVSELIGMHGSRPRLWRIGIWKLWFSFGIDSSAVYLIKQLTQPGGVLESSLENFRSLTQRRRRGAKERSLPSPSHFIITPDDSLALRNYPSQRTFIVVITYRPRRHELSEAID